jgi:hypothetical protein
MAKRLVEVRVIGGTGATDRQTPCRMAVVSGQRLARRVELDFDAAQLPRVVESWNDFKFVFGL